MEKLQKIIPQKYNTLLNHLIIMVNPAIKTPAMTELELNNKKLVEYDQKKAHRQKN